MSLKKVPCYFDKSVRINGGYNIDCHVNINGKVYILINEYGQRDDVEAFFDGKTLWVIARFDNCGYVSLSAYDIALMTQDEPNDMVGEMFLQGDLVREILGKRGLEYSSRHIVRVMSTYTEHFGGRYVA